MRGVAALSAGLAGWTLARGSLPRIRWPKLPRIDLKTSLLALVVGAVAATLTLGLAGSPTVAAAIGVLTAALPMWREASRAARCRAAVADGWPDFLAVLRSHLSGGSSLPEAFVVAGRRSSRDLASAADALEEHLARGGSFHAGLDEMRARFDDPIADRVLATLAAAQQSGGSRVAAVLAALGTSVADELRLRKAHDAALTQQRLTAAVALLAPWALLLLTVATNPQAASVYSTTSGNGVVLGGLAATGGGYLLARRTASLSRPPRLFKDDR